MDAELKAWLGPAAAEMTGEEIERFADVASLLQARYPHPDQAHERESAMSAVVQVFLGEATAHDIRDHLAGVLLEAARTRAAAVGAAVGLVRVYGVGKSAAAHAVGINRMTLLEALGERERRRAGRRTVAG